MQREWTGLMVCSADWDPRHPQDFVRGVPDNQTVPISSPEPADVFIGDSDYDATDVLLLGPAYGANDALLLGDAYDPTDALLITG
ncbi:MAG: hypothetical protein GY943_07515 [Chloroflexi bacterium]|nr:hypothetical protein [Chloroflexota bacterium]